MFFVMVLFHVVSFLGVVPGQGVDAGVVYCEMQASCATQPLHFFFGLRMFHMLFPLCTVRDAHGNGWNIKGDGREVASVSTNCA